MKTVFANSSNFNAVLNVTKFGVQTYVSKFHIESILCLSLTALRLRNNSYLVEERLKKVFFVISTVELPALDRK